AFSERGNGWLSILKVRLMHAAVRVKIGQHTNWDTKKWGEPINQEDMTGTLISFSLIVLMGLRKLGYTVTEREAEVYFQRWQMIGAKLGLQQEMLPKTRAQAFRLAKCIEKRHMRPSEAGKSLNQVLIKESERSAQGQLPKGYISALMRYLLGEKVAHCVGLNESSWADPVVQLLFMRQKYFAAPPTTSPEKLHAEYLEVKTQLLQVA
ncbi:MAG: oxygenase MpaB family protein, partial [Bacteroidota bacterium]